MTTHKMTVAIEKLKKKLESQLVKGQHVNVGVNNNSEIATYATYLEYGWVQTVTARQEAFFRATIDPKNAPHTGSTLVMPARPTFHSTVLANSNKWVNIARFTMKNTQGPYNSAVILATVGAVAMSDIKATIAQGGNTKQTFAERSDLTMLMLQYRAETTGHKAGGNTATRKPLVLTGNFLNSITYQIEG